MKTLPVIFRADQSGMFENEVTAVFPTLPGTNDIQTFSIYSHAGQRGVGSLGWYRLTRPAKPKEYAQLLAELRGIYETGPDAVKLVERRKMSQAMKVKRIEAMT